MHKFKSKPIQLNGDMVLCQDGSIWAYNAPSDSYEQIGGHEPNAKTKKAEKGYTEKFEEFWKAWGSNVNNSCPKVDAFKKWNSLSLKEQSDATSFITAYAKSNNDHQYLKRANTYLSNKMWESAEHIAIESASVIPPLTSEVWTTEIYNQTMGITETAREQVTRFGMSQEEAWRLINDA